MPKHVPLFRSHDKGSADVALESLLQLTGQLLLKEWKNSTLGAPGCDAAPTVNKLGKYWRPKEDDG